MLAARERHGTEVDFVGIAAPAPTCGQSDRPSRGTFSDLATGRIASIYGSRVRMPRHTGNGPPQPALRPFPELSGTDSKP